jgi:ABC-type sugar transport system ATPase subunit
MARIELSNVSKTIEATGSFLGNALTRMIFPSAFAGGSKTYGKHTFSLKAINLIVPDGKTMVILGSSGCGKTTLLKLIAGLITPDSGEVLYNGVDMAGVQPSERQIGMVFQNYALYPNFSAEENILSYFKFGKKTPELNQQAKEKFQRTSELMGVDIEHMIDKMPAKLSSGERQRVALARCITRDPALFLMDEPFSNLDQKLREKYRVSLKKLLQHFQITTIYVTHDQREAVLLADIISIMDQGEIVQVGTYQEIYHAPKNIFTAEFLNLDNETKAINLCQGEAIDPNYAGKIIGFRPEDALVVAKGSGILNGRIIDIYTMPLKKQKVLTLEFGSVDIQIYAEGMFEQGEQVELRIERMHVFDAMSGERI